MNYLQYVRGYTAPEYALHGHLSEKVDTYSFGIVVLEIISGRKSSDVQVEPTTEYLLEQVISAHFSKSCTNYKLEFPKTCSC